MEERGIYPSEAYPRAMTKRPGGCQHGRTSDGRSCVSCRGRTAPRRHLPRTTCTVSSIGDCAAVDAFSVTRGRFVHLWQGKVRKCAGCFLFVEQRGSFSGHDAIESEECVIRISLRLPITGRNLVKTQRERYTDHCARGGHEV